MDKKRKVIIAIVLIILLGILIFAIVTNNKANEVTITFDSNGGEKVKSQDVTKGEKAEEPKDPEREGYEFIGWYYDGKKFDFDQELTEDVELEAKWIKVGTIKYTVTFDSNGGSSVKSQKVKKNKKVTEPAKPTRSGYTFVGWTLDGKTYSFSTKVTKNITLKAVWRKNASMGSTITTVTKPSTGTTTQTKPTKPEEPTIKKYTVKFVDGTTVLDEVEVEEGKTVAEPAEPQKTGFLFKGWIYNENSYDFTTKVTTDMKIEATWKSTTANVSTLDELKIALADEEIEIISLQSNISNIDETLYANNTVTINGNSKVLTFNTLARENGVATGLVIASNNSVVNDLVIAMSSAEGWDGNYAMQVYNATGVVINNYTGKGADAALLVNGSEVELTGTTTVTGNEFGGIEASKGSALTANAKLTVTGTIVYADEEASRPALWTVNGQATVVSTNLTEKEMTAKSQTYYYVSAASENTINVNTLEELEAALADTQVKIINITENILNVNKSLIVNNPVTINGNNYTLGFDALAKDASGNASGLVILANDTTVNNLTISMEKVTGWNSHYAMQVYGATGVVINSYTGKGADAALLVNGSEVELKGLNNVAGNEFGGIEVSRGTALTANGKLTLTGTLSMEDEKIDHPAIWVVNGQGSVISTGTTLTEKIVAVKNQTFYYVHPESATTVYVDTLDELKAALADSTIKTINLENDITSINETITASHTVTINGNNHTLGFNDLAKVDGVASGLVISGNNSVVNNLKVTMPGIASWKSQYAMQVYNATGVVINNYTGSGADAALLVNSSDVTLNGTTTVTGNEFGGIEASKSTSLDRNSTLTINGTIVMSDEAPTCPAVWIENGEATVTSTLTEVIKTDQTYYFLNVTI